MKKVGGLQISVNFMVMLVLGIMSFGLGMTIIYNLTEDMDDLARQVDEQTERELNNLLVQGAQQVSVPVTGIDIRRGENKELGFGIKNTAAEGTEDFTIAIECVLVYDHDDNQQCEGAGECMDDEGLCSNEADEDKVAVRLHDDMEGSPPDSYYWKRDIERRDRLMENMFVMAGSQAEEGRYIFRLEVTKEDDPDGADYGTPRRFTVSVY